MTDIADDVDEHPIIFNDWSVRRILAGEKTQTRRIIDFDDLDPIGGLDLTPEDWEFEGFRNKATASFRGENSATWMHSPYGVAGDALWVREAFRLPSGVHSIPKEYVEHCGDRTPIVKYEADESTNADCSVWVRIWNGTLKPAIHMPRELCRLRLRVEDVRVERIQEVSPADACAEGIARKAKRNRNGEVVDEMNPVGGFKKLWNDIHGDGAWERNDWVWVVAFSRIE